MKLLPRHFLLAALLGAAALTSACSGLSSGDNRAADNAAGASRSGVEVFGTIDAGVSRTDTKR